MEEVRDDELEDEELEVEVGGLLDVMAGLDVESEVDDQGPELVSGDEL